MKDTDRGRVLARWIGLLPIEDKECRAKEMWSKESSNRLCDTLSRETLKDEIEEIKSTINERNLTIAENIKKIDDANGRMSENQKEKDELLSSKQNIDKNLLTVDVATVEKQMADLIEDGKKKANEKKTLDEDVERLGR